MKEILILVEGQTEESFVNDVLQAHFAGRLLLRPSIIRTQHNRQTFNKGGLVSFEQLQREIKRLLSASHVPLVTSMLDFYPLRRRFVGYDDLPQGTAYQQVEHVEATLKQSIADPRFLPYFALYEFEALLFSDVEQLDAALTLFGESSALASLRQIRQAVASPEEINFANPPSKLLEQLYKGYRKVAYGSLIAQDLGLPALRHACPHFAAWLDLLETSVQAH